MKTGGLPVYVINYKKKYRFLLLEDFSYKLNIQAGDCDFYSKGIHLASLRGGILTIKKGFSWDGCSPYRVLGFRWFSIPSPKETARGSLLHDLFYQFLHTEGSPWHGRRDWADDEFKNILKEDGFRLRGVYYVAVDWFGQYFVREDKNFRVVLFTAVQPLTSLNPALP